MSNQHNPRKPKLTADEEHRERVRFDDFKERVKLAIRQRWPVFYFNGVKVDGCAHTLDVAGAMLNLPEETGRFLFHFCMCMGGEASAASSECIEHLQILLHALEKSRHQTIQTQFNKNCRYHNMAYRPKVRTRWIAVTRQMIELAKLTDQCKWIAHYHGLTDQPWLSEK